MNVNGDLPNILSPVSGNRQQGVLPSELSAKQSVPDFQVLMKQAIDKVNSLQESSASLMHDVDAGKSDDLLGAMIAVQKAGISFQALVQVRNKAVSAYEEIMRMQI